MYMYIKCTCISKRYAKIGSRIFRRSQKDRALMQHDSAEEYIVLRRERQYAFTSLPTHFHPRLDTEEL